MLFKSVQRTVLCPGTYIRINIRTVIRRRQITEATCHKNLYIPGEAGENS